MTFKVREILADFLRSLGVTSWQGRITQGEIQMIIEALYSHRIKIASDFNGLTPNRRSKNCSGVDHLVDRYLRIIETGGVSQDGTAQPHSARAA